MPWVRRLQRRFSPRRLLLGKDSNLSLESEGSDALVCVVGRALCLFVHVDAGRVPEKQQREFIGLAVRRAAPFADPDFSVAWGSGGHAAVWYWSRAKIRELLAARHVRAGRIRFEAEPLYVKGACQNGVELLELHEGVEGRVWRDDSLVASRWWSAPPTAQDWLAYARAAGHTVDQRGEPQAARHHLLTHPWGARSSSASTALHLSGLDRHLPAVTRAAGLIVATIAAVQTGSLLRSGIDTWRAQHAAEQLDDPLKRILAAREAADGHLVAINQLMSLRHPHTLLDLIAEVTQLLPAGGQVSHWNQPVPERVEITLVLADADPQALVQAWEASPRFEGVTADMVGRSGEIVIRAGVSSIPKVPTP